MVNAYVDPRLYHVQCPHFTLYNKNTPTTNARGIEDGDCDAMVATAAAVVTHIQNLSQGVGSGDERLRKRIQFNDWGGAGMQHICPRFERERHEISPYRGHI